jgi:hypothetical protein
MRLRKADSVPTEMKGNVAPSRELEALSAVGVRGKVEVSSTSP